MKKNFCVFVLLCLFFGFVSGADARENGAKFIFLFIGDGMGKAQYQAGNARGLTSNMELLPVRSNVSTRSHGGAITDSAAAATAIATGTKTKNGMLGLDANGKRLENVAERAKSTGMKVGIISTMSLNHATPAGFYAHIHTREDYYSIGAQLAQSGFDYFGGGGLHREKGKGNDRESLFEIAEKAGYKIFRKGKTPNISELKNERVFSVNPALRSDSCMPYSEKRPADGRPLSDFVSEAIELLYNEKGFLIVVEGGNIDYACHDHEFERAMAEIADFDKALAPALEFYKNHPNDTLIIATADHETGGLSLEPKISWSTRGHTGTDVPIFANIRLDSVKDNTDIAKLIFREMKR